MAATAATESLTLYRVSNRRGDVPTRLPAAWSFTTASNPMAPSKARAMRSATPIICANSRALIEFDHEPWAAAHARLPARRQPGGRGSQGARRKPRSTPPFSSASTPASGTSCAKGSPSTASLPRLPQGRYAASTKRRPGENLLRRLHQFKDDVLRFLADFEVPFTNNLAEQALRMMKVKMKISGALPNFRRPLKCFAALRSVIATARKLGLRTSSKPSPRPSISSSSHRRIANSLAVTKVARATVTAEIAAANLRAGCDARDCELQVSKVRPGRLRRPGRARIRGQTGAARPSRPRRAR